jgi:hypothetical protein
MAEKTVALKQPGMVVEFMNLLEDAGVINIKDKKIDFDTAMFRTSFYLPDPVINLIVVFSVVYSAHLAGWL